MPLKSIFSVSQPRSGHHLMEMMLRASLRERFRYCEFYTEPGCCGAIPCKRRQEFASQNYVLFMQKSHDMNAADPLPNGVDVILIQTREPTLRSLSNYELDLRFHNLAHSSPYLQYFLATEAFYNVRFYHKWIKPGYANALLLRYEDLLLAPSDSLARLLRHLGIEISDVDLAAGVREVRFSSADRSSFSLRKMETSRFFDPDIFREFLSLLSRDANYLDYPPWSEASKSTGTIGAIYQALRAAHERNFPAVLAAVGPILHPQDVWPAVWQLYAEALLGIGEQKIGRRMLEKLLRIHPEYLDGYLALATIERNRGDLEAARTLVRTGVERTGNVIRAREFLTYDWPDEALRAWLPSVAETVSREDVIAAFRWILGREPESEDVITAHLRCLGAQDLRLTLLRSDEFRKFFAGLHQTGPRERSRSEPPMLLSAELVGEAFRWILGREPESATVIAAHQKARSPEELRYVLLNSEEFRRFFPH